MTDAEWYGRYFNCPESYVDPLQQYDLCKARGMDLVTLTDHDTLAGGLKLVDRPDFFLSEEITARFPENGCVMHVLAWNIDPDQHGAIQERRDDVYALTDYLQDRGIAYGLAHPLLSPNWKLDRETFEKVLLLFPTFEVVNGLTDARIEKDLVDMMASVDEGVIARLAAKHNLRPHGARPHVKAETAGSDDHVHRRNGTVYTEVDGATLPPATFLARVLAGQGRAVGHNADLNAMAAGAQRTTSGFLRRREGEPPLSGGDPVTDLMDVALGGDASTKGASFLAPLIARAASRPEAAAMPPDAARAPTDPAPLPVDSGELDRQDAAMTEMVAHAFDAAGTAALDSLIGALSVLDFYRILDGLRDLTAAAGAAAPYFFAAHHYGKQVAQVLNLRRDWTASQIPERRRRLAVFSDSLEQVDGVSTWCERFITEAKGSGCDVLVPYCGDRASHPDGHRFHPLPAVRMMHLPFYSQIRLYIPSLVSTVDWMWRHEVSNVELSTPGPMGLVGLLAAKLLRLPVTATYHTEIPTLISILGGDSMLREAARRYLVWFYNRADAAFVFSQKARRGLVEVGVKESHIEVLPITVNPDHFNPQLGSPSIFRELGIDLEGRPVVLSVGRLSEEKNVPMIVEAVRRLQHEPFRPLLVIVGDGPELGSLQARFAGDACVRFVGLQRGERLRRLYASAHAFAFASRVDTLGLVNLEAMSSGVPVLLPSDASATDMAKDGVSAEFYPFGVEGLTHAIRRVLGDREYAGLLATNARLAMVDRWSSHPFSAIWESFTRPSP
jgi:glycosyltransferase involved in cell wall biosynthesis/predicted metal-dependent phosphoesterase TrpH